MVKTPRASPAPKNRPRHPAGHAKSNRFLFQPNKLDFWHFSFPKTPSRNSTCHWSFFCRNWATTFAISNCCLRFIVKRTHFQRKANHGETYLCVLRAFVVIRHLRLSLSSPCPPCLRGEISE